MPNGRSRIASSSSDSRPVRASASTSPASRRSVSRMARWRISSRATTVTACWRISRSKSPSPPVSLAATSHACGAPRPRRETGSTSERPAMSGWSGANSELSTVRLPLPASSSLRRRLGDLAADGLRRERVAAARGHADRPPGGCRQRAHDLVEPALLEHEPLEPLVDRDPPLEHLVLLVHEPGERLLRQRDEGQL